MPLVLPSVLPEEFQPVLKAADLAEGWLHVNEQRLLYVLGKTTQGPVLEFGCFKGKSTTCILLGRRAAKLSALHVVVDLFQDYLDTGAGDFEQDFRRNVAPHTGHTQLKVLRMSSFDSGPALREMVNRVGGFAGIFVDALHTYEAVAKDSRLAGDLLAPGGWLAFHDAMRWAGTNEVLRACLDNESLDDYGYLGSYASVLLLQKPSAMEKFVSWKSAASLTWRRAWMKTRLPVLLGKCHAGVMHSPLRKPFMKAVRTIQRRAGA